MEPHTLQCDCDECLNQDGALENQKRWVKALRKEHAKLCKRLASQLARLDYVKVKVAKQKIDEHWRVLRKHENALARMLDAHEAAGEVTEAAE